MAPQRVVLSILLASCAVLACTAGAAQSTGAAPSATPSATPDAAPVDTASVARGQRLFLRCASCHDVTGAAIEKNGPTLKGVFGRPVAKFPGYVYSKSLSEQSFNWDAAHLDAWLARPTLVAPGTTMAFEGLPQAADRKALIDYLREQR